MQSRYHLSTRYIVPLFLLTLLATACEKQDDGPTSADVARCAHIDRDADLGEALYDICLNNPWPTELPPATQEGLSTFGGIINDTLVFVAGSPRAFPDQSARAKLTYLSGGGINVQRLLLCGFGTYAAIDSSEIGIELAVLPSGLLKPRAARSSGRIFRVVRHDESINGTYFIDTSRYNIQIDRWDDRVVAGTIDAWFVHAQDSAKELHLSDGRFDLTVQP